MPGICGIVSTNATPESMRETVHRMVTPLVRSTQVCTSYEYANGCAIANVAIDGDRPVYQEEGLILAVSGFITDADRLVKRLQVSGVVLNPEFSLGQVLLKAYLYYGLDALCGLNGIYTIALWKVGLKKLVLISDRMGVGKMYFCQQGRNLLFSNEQKAICLLPDFNNQIDPLGVADFISVENVLEDRTFFANIKIMDAAQVLTFKNGQISTRRYWDYSFFEPGNTALRADAYVDGLAYELRQALIRRLHPQTTLLLTGGLDSRSLAGAWSEVAGGIPLLANTIGQEGCRDVAQAREIAASVNMEHLVIPVDDSYLANYASECVWRTEGNINVHASWIFAEDQLFKSRQILYAMTGINGDLMGGRFQPKEILRASQQNELEAFLKNQPWMRNSLAKRILRPEIFKKVDGVSFQTLWNITQRANTRIPVSQYDYLEFHAFIRREATSVDVLSDFVWVLDPYMDMNLVDYVFSQPPQYRTGSLLYKKMITRHFPQVSRVSYGDDTVPLKRQVADQESHILNWLSRTGRRIQNRLSPKTGWLDGDRPYWTVPLNGSIRQGSREFVRQVFAESQYYDDIFDVKAVNQLLQDHLNGRINDFKAIGTVLTFALWRKMFAYDKSSLSAIPLDGLIRLKTQSAPKV